MCPTIVYWYSTLITPYVVKSPVLAYWNLIWLAQTFMSDKGSNAEHFVVTIGELKENALVFMVISLINNCVKCFLFFISYLIL